MRGFDRLLTFTETPALVAHQLSRPQAVSNSIRGYFCISRVIELQRAVTVTLLRSTVDHAARAKHHDCVRRVMIAMLLP